MSWFWKGLKPLSYGLIYADPPWNFETWSQKGNARGVGYDTMSLQQIYDMRLADLAAPDCLLALWVTDPMLRFAFECLDSWGFEYKTVGYTWTKTAKHMPEMIQWPPLKAHFPIGMGHHTVIRWAFLRLALATPRRRADCALLRA